MALSRPQCLGDIPALRKSGRHWLRECAPRTTAPVWSTASSPRTAGCACRVRCTPGDYSTCPPSTAACRAGWGTLPTPLPTACGAAYLVLLLCAEHLC